MSDSSSAPTGLSRLKLGFDVIPLNNALGIEIFDVDIERGVAWMKLPYDDKLVGNPETGVVHGGAVTALLDTTCGAAVFAKMQRWGAVATLDLRIDYLKPGTPREDIVARAECYKLTSNVAFVRSIAYHSDENDPIASAAGAFMVNTRPKKADGDEG